VKKSELGASIPRVAYKKVLTFFKLRRGGGLCLGVLVAHKAMLDLD